MRVEEICGLDVIPAKAGIQLNHRSQLKGIDLKINQNMETFYFSSCLNY